MTGKYVLVSTGCLVVPKHTPAAGFDEARRVMGLALLVGISATFREPDHLTRITQKNRLFLSQPLYKRRTRVIKDIVLFSKMW